MGTIAAIGGGRYDNGEIFPILKHIVALAGKPEPNILYVPTAGFDYIVGDEAVFEIFGELGGNITNLFLTNPNLTPAYIERTVLSADIIYVRGGNLKFLADTWKATGADKAFKKAYDRGIILSGYSSGAMCWCNEGYDDCGENKSFMFVDCLGLLPYSCCPHFESEGWSDFENAVKGRKYPGLAIENGAAAIFRGTEMYSISGTDGGKAYILGKDGSKTAIEPKGEPQRVEAD